MRDVRQPSLTAFYSAGQKPLPRICAWQNALTTFTAAVGACSHRYSGDASPLKNKIRRWICKDAVAERTSANGAIVIRNFCRTTRAKTTAFLPQLHSLNGRQQEFGGGNTAKIPTLLGRRFLRPARHRGPLRRRREGAYNGTACAPFGSSREPGQPRRNFATYPRNISHLIASATEELGPVGFE